VLSKPIGQPFPAADRRIDADRLLQDVAPRDSNKRMTRHGRRSDVVRLRLTPAAIMHRQSRQQLRVGAPTPDDRSATSNGRSRYKSQQPDIAIARQYIGHGRRDARRDGRRTRVMVRYMGVVEVARMTGRWAESVPRRPMPASCRRTWSTSWCREMAEHWASRRGSRVPITVSSRAVFSTAWARAGPPGRRRKVFGRHGADNADQWSHASCSATEYAAFWSVKWGGGGGEKPDAEQARYGGGYKRGTSRLQPDPPRLCTETCRHASSSRRSSPRKQRRRQSAVGLVPRGSAPPTPGDRHSSVPGLRNRIAQK